MDKETRAREGDTEEPGAAEGETRLSNAGHCAGQKRGHTFGSIASIEAERQRVEG